MKKYGKLIGLALFSIVVIGGFYVKAEANTPEYTIEMRSGDEQYIEDMVLFGNVNNEESMYWESVQIGTEGTKVSTDFSFNEQLDYLYAYSPEMQKLYHTHKDFLRNKNIGDNLYYEDEEVLAYVEAQMKNGELIYQQMNIAVLDKKSDEEEELVVEIPEYNKYEDLYIEDVQKNNTELVILTTNYLSAAQMAEDHVYRVNLESKEITDTVLQPLSKEKDEASSAVMINTLTNSNTLGTDQFWVYDINTSTTGNKGLVAYDVAAGEMKELAVPDEWREQAFPQMFKVHGSSIYYSNVKEDGFEIQRFDISSNQAAETQFIGLPGEVMDNFTADRDGSGGNFFTCIKDNVVYYVSPTKGGSEQSIAIVVGDLETGKVLYDGTVENSSNMSKHFKDNMLTIDSVFFQ